MKITFVIISVSDRVNDLNLLLETIIQNKQFSEYDVNLLFQDYLGNSDKIKYKDRYANIFICKEKLGCHGARVTLLRNLEGKGYDFYINLDDDMELILYTNYTRAIEKAGELNTGFVLTNWARTASLAEKKIPNLTNKFVKQIMVYQGGGMVYAEKIAKLMRKLPVCHAEFDDIWCLTSYISGYDNFRDLSSVAIHHICGTGGMHNYMREKQRPLLCKNYINYRYGQKGMALIPLDKDVNQKARNLHKINKLKLEGTDENN